MLHRWYSLCSLAACTTEALWHELPQHGWRIALDVLTTSLCLSRYFNAGPCELRLGVYESFDTLCIYLESDAVAGDPERNFWVKYRCADEANRACVAH